MRRSRGHTVASSCRQVLRRWVRSCDHSGVSEPVSTQTRPGRATASAPGRGLVPAVRGALRQGRLPGFVPGAIVPVRVRLRGVRAYVHGLHAEDLRCRDRSRRAAGARAACRRVRLDRRSATHATDVPGRGRLVFRGSPRRGRVSQPGVLRGAGVAAELPGHREALESLRHPALRERSGDGQDGRRMGRWKWGVGAVAAIVVVATTTRALAASAIDVPWIVPDEFLYAALGKSLWSDGQLAIRDEPVPFYTALVPLIAAGRSRPSARPRDRGDPVAERAADLRDRDSRLSLDAVPLESTVGHRRCRTHRRSSWLPVLGADHDEALFVPICVLGLWSLANSSNVRRSSLLESSWGS